MSSLAPLVDSKRIFVCAGTGGVGKTSVSAALGLGAALRGKRVLVLTIDPSRRLAEALGIRQNTPDPVPLGPERESELGIEPPGSLSVWVLDPKRVSDQTVRRLSRSPKEAERLLANPIYQRVTSMIAGMQEYTAMEALHGFVQQGTYDIVILDTPPSRNALNFLEAPNRLAASMNTRIVELMRPATDSGLIGTTRRFLERVLGGVFGGEFFADLQVFFGAFGGMFVKLSGNAEEMRARLSQPDVAFLLVTSSRRDALDQAKAFEARIRELQLPLGALVLNRSLVPLARRPFPDASLLPAEPSAHHRSALDKLVQLAVRESKAINAAVDLSLELEQRAEVPVVAVPELGSGVDDLPGLASVSTWLFGEAGPAWDPHRENS
jgi:anion-transporting  ArsA/GET3 family ATPase